MDLHVNYHRRQQPAGWYRENTATEAEYPQMSGAVIDRKAIKFTDEGREDGMSVQQAQAGEQLHTHTRAHTHAHVNNPYSLSLTETRAHTHTHASLLSVSLTTTQIHM